MSTRKERRFRMEAALATVVGAFVRRLPRRAALFLGGFLGRIWAALDPRHVAIAVDNLRHAFPDWSEARATATARGVYRHFARVMFDLLWLQGRSRERVMGIVDAEGVEHAEKARLAGRGCVFVGAHFGGWEIHAVSHAWRIGEPVSVLARPLDNPHLDRRLNAVRQMSGNHVIYKQRALVQVMRRLREGGSIAILVDQNMQEQDGIFVEFFGRPACTTTVAAALAVKTGCAIVPVRSELLPSGRYRAVCEPALQWTPSADREADIAALTQQMTTVIEGWIRNRPEQWLWLHRRWKTRPSQERAHEAAV